MASAPAVPIPGAGAVAAGHDGAIQSRAAKGAPPAPRAFVYQPRSRDPFVAASVSLTLVVPPKAAEPPPEESPVAQWHSALARLVAGWQEAWVLHGISAGSGGAGASAIVNGRIVRVGEDLTVPVPAEVRGRLVGLAATLGAGGSGVEVPGPDGVTVRVIAIEGERVKFSVGGRRHGREFALVRRPAVAPAAVPSSAPARAPFVMTEKLR